MLSTLARTKYREALHDHCGEFGIFGPGEQVAKIAYFAIYSLQHRGQEGAGIAVTNGRRVKAVKKLGLVTQVFSEKQLATLTGHIAVGHTRYSTTGGNTKHNLQPMTVTTASDLVTVAHNGNLINAHLLAAMLPRHARTSTSDSEVLALSLIHQKGQSWPEKIVRACERFEGAYSVVACTHDTLFAFRDPWGFRPLILGKLNGGYVVASETCAFDIIGATFIREVEPGEIIAIDKNGWRTVGKIEQRQQSFCIFEYVYLARPDSIFNEKMVHTVRRKSGEILAREAPIAADLVAAIPDSGTSAAIGYAEESGIPFGEVLIKNRYIGRTFISPEQHLREQGVKMKFNPMASTVKGKRIIIVDDSIVRGTTMKQLVTILRAAGAKEIHVRICSPPVTDPCYFGVDTSKRKNLIAAQMSVSKIKQYIGADSLRYLSLPGLIQATGLAKNTLCTGCFTGKYPIKVDEAVQKDVLTSAC